MFKFFKKYKVIASNDNLKVCNLPNFPLDVFDLQVEVFLLEGHGELIGADHFQPGDQRQVRR